MKTLQNDLTTIEQSKRLLELGVPADSADCYYQKIKQEDNYELFVGENIAIKENLFSYRNGYTIPCWSVGRLIEIYLKCNLKGKSMIIAKRHDPIGRCLYVFENEQLDFSKLEE